MKKKIVFLTGATGFLGSHIFREILEHEKNTEIYILVRAKNKYEAEKRMLLVAKNIPKKKFNRHSLNRAHIVVGDQTSSDLYLCKRELKKISDSVVEIYHCAASVNFRVTLMEARRVNVIGAKNIFDFALKCNNLTKLNYISTTFVAGNKEGVFSETSDMRTFQDFNNAYEKSKFEAEQLIFNKYKNRELKFLIFRPSIITGEYLSGFTSSFKMIYEPLHFFSMELFKAVPATVSMVHNLIPVDTAAKAIYVLARNEQAKNEIYHIISPNSITFGYFMDLASKFFGYRNPSFIPLDIFNMKLLTTTQRSILSPFIPYFNYKAIFDGSITQKKLEKYNFKQKYINEAYLLRIFRFCKTSGFIK